MDLFSHSWLPFMYQYGFGILIFGGGLFAVFKAYGGKEFWIGGRVFKPNSFSGILHRVLPGQ